MLGSLLLSEELIELSNIFRMQFHCINERISFVKPLVVWKISKGFLVCLFVCLFVLGTIKPTACTGLLCDGGSMCVPTSKLCDGYTDCADKTDEYMCSECLLWWTLENHSRIVDMLFRSLGHSLLEV